MKSIITDNQFEDLEQYHKMFGTIQEEIKKAVNQYNIAKSELELGLNLGRIYSVAETTKIDFLHTMVEMAGCATEHTATHKIG